MLTPLTVSQEHMTVAYNPNISRGFWHGDFMMLKAESNPYAKTTSQDIGWLILDTTEISVFVIVVTAIPHEVFLQKDSTWPTTEWNSQAKNHRKRYWMIAIRQYTAKGYWPSIVSLWCTSHNSFHLTAHDALMQISSWPPLSFKGQVRSVTAPSNPGQDRGRVGGIFLIRRMLAHRIHMHTQIHKHGLTHTCARKPAHTPGRKK